MEKKAGYIIATVVMLVIALSLLLPGLLTTGWAKCGGTEYGLFEQCEDIIVRSCSSYTWSGGVRSAAAAMVIIDIVAAFTGLIYSVILLIQIINNQDSFKNKYLSKAIAVMLVFGGVICIAGILVFSGGFEIPCPGGKVQYSAYITGTGTVLAILASGGIGASENETTQISPEELQAQAERPRTITAVRSDPLGNQPPVAQISDGRLPKA